METISKEGFSFFHKLRVRWSEVDPQGIVFNPNYLVYVDIVFTEYMRAIGFPYPAALLKYGADTFAVHTEINFRGSAMFDDELELGARVSKIGRTSMTITAAIFRGDELLCDVDMVYVSGDPETKKPLPVPEPFIDAVLAFEKHPPERKTG
ncbi:MAG: acyl-CoA thioesterase [Methyloligellaceae bacterium]